MRPQLLPYATHCFDRVVRNISPGLHREPLLDEADFERFVQAFDSLMQAGRDVLWVLVGRTDSNIPKVKDERCSVPPLLQHETNAAVRLLEEAAGHCQFEEPGASFLCLHGQDAQAHA